MTHRILITGAAGYVGGMLCDLFSRRGDVDAVIGLDKEPMPETLRGHPKLRWIAANTADPSWRATAAAEHPDLVVHAAWQIRELYGQGELQRKWNVDGADNVFDFAFETPSVKRLLYFSSLAPYGAQPDNSIERRFTEDRAFRDSDFRYAEEKRIVEQNLERKFAQAHERGSEIAVTVMRPAAIAGPRGRRLRAGVLQSALPGQASGGVRRRLPQLVPFIPVTPQWCRQFIHEDDLADIAELLAFGVSGKLYEVFNACPPGDLVLAADVAQAMQRPAIRLHPQLIRLAFFFLWHASRGRVPAPRGSWKSYSYPLAADGSKLIAMSAFQYRWDARSAFTSDAGRYAGGGA